MPHDAFFAVQNIFIYLGDSLSRQLVYRAPRLRHPFVFLVFSAAGIVLGLCKIPILSPPGVPYPSPLQDPHPLTARWSTFKPHGTSAELPPRYQHAPSACYVWY